MDPPRSPFAPPVLSAPGTADSAPRYCPPQGEAYPAPRPPVDDHVVRPGTREELVRGRKILAQPAKMAHATQQLRLDYVLQAHVAEGFLGASDMLTRTDAESDFAPDASVFPAEPDPKTGRRQLEHIAFEVCSEQDSWVPKTKARLLIDRGVRRVFCILVKEDGDGLKDPGPDPKRSRRQGRKETRILEWSRETDGWSLPLPVDGVIEAECFSPPLPLRALLDAAASDDAVAKALRVRGNRIFQEERQAGHAEGQATLLLSLIVEKFGEIDGEVENRIRSADGDRLLSWAKRILTAERLEDVFRS